MFQKRLLKYDKWVSDNQPVQSNLNQLTKWRLIWIFHLFSKIFFL
jgi:hypothetical protein